MTIKLVDNPVSLADQITAKVTIIAGAATAEERAAVEAMREKAKRHRGAAVQEKVEITPAMAAILFLDYNNFNRPWDPSWTNDLGRIMTSGDWRLTNQGYGLYGDDGSVGDGAHRMAAQAYTGTTLTMWMYYGMEKEDVAALDCGKRRTAADAAALAGVIDSKSKSELLQTVWAYEKSVGIANHVNTANVKAVAEQIKACDALLARALEIGETSLVDAIDPLLAAKQGAKVMALLLRHRWPEARALERLDEVQTCDFDNDKAPLLVARKFIEENRAPKEVLAKQREIGVVIKGMLMAETGVLVNPKRTNEIKNAAKHAPDPTYPSQSFGTTGDREESAA
jgi:hypothetical protein